MQIDLPDRIERARAQWADEEPGLDTSPMEVIGRVLRAAHLADAHIRRVLRQQGLDRSGFDVLATLRRTGPPYQLTPTALYQELVLTSGAMTHRVDALARAGLVERVSGPTDRRSNLVGLTARGQSVVDGAMTAHLQCEATMIAPLPDEDREALAALLKKLLRGIEEEA
jgi:DNA-binding MarR family transcriptional regulator